MSTRSRNASATVGVSRFHDVARTSVSELFDAVNLSGQRHLGLNVEMASTVVLTDTNVSERRDDGGYLWSIDGDVTTVYDAVNTSGQR